VNGMRNNDIFDAVKELMPELKIDYMILDAGTGGVNFLSFS